MLLWRYGPQTKEGTRYITWAKASESLPIVAKASDMFAWVQQLLSVHDNKLRSGILLAFFGLCYGKKRLELKWLSCD